MTATNFHSLIPRLWRSCNALQLASCDSFCLDSFKRKLSYLRKVMLSWLPPPHYRMNSPTPDSITCLYGHSFPVFDSNIDQCYWLSSDWLWSEQKSPLFFRGIWNFFALYVTMNRSPEQLDLDTNLNIEFKPFLHSWTIFVAIKNLLKVFRTSGLPREIAKRL